MKLEYDYDEQVIYVKRENGSKEILEDEFPSEPVISPDKTRAAYISPLEWETLGSLYMYDLLSEEKSTLVVPNVEQHIPKVVQWLDNHKLIVIIGYAYGTVAIGGNAFIYNLGNQELIQLTHYSMHTQFVEIKIDNNNEKVFLEGIEYIDEQMAEFKQISEELSLTDYLD